MSLLFEEEKMIQEEQNKNNNNNDNNEERGSKSEGKSSMLWSTCLRALNKAAVKESTSRTKQRSTIGGRWRRRRRRRRSTNNKTRKRQKHKKLDQHFIFKNVINNIFLFIYLFITINYIPILSIKLFTHMNTNKQNENCVKLKSSMGIQFIM